MSSEVQHREAFETYMRAQNACVRLARQSEEVGGEYRTTSVQKACVLWLASIDRCSSEQAVRAQLAAEVERLTEALENEEHRSNGFECALKLMTAERDSAQAEAKRLREALQPFAEFVFGPKWAGHTLIERSGDANVMCGYDDEGNTTGINVMYSDFKRARAALQPGASHG